MDNLESLETLEIAEVGNSKRSTSKQSTQFMMLFFTYNNYKPGDIEILETTFKNFEKTKKYVFQKEICPTTNTPHLQGNIWFSKKTRWEELRLPFGNLVRWARTNNPKAAEKYCQKSATSEPGSKPYIYGFPKPLKLITPDKDWQIEILKILETEPNDRHVYWFWSSEGGIGKSSFCKYLAATKKIVFIDEGKKGDIMYSIMEANMDECNLVLFDIPRDNGNKISYKSIESIKNGMIFSSKYESGQKLFNSPHVICFANVPPDLSKLSEDRWVVKNIDIIKNDIEHLALCFKNQIAKETST